MHVYIDIYIIIYIMYDDVQLGEIHGKKPCRTFGIWLVLNSEYPYSPFTRI
jgi:hypothetical protein